MSEGGHFGFLPITQLPTLLRGAPLLFYYLTFKEDKTIEKPTFALHGHGSAPYDPTKYTVLWKNII